MRGEWRAMAIAGLAAMLTAAVPTRTTYAFGSWASLDRGATCEALTRTEQLAADPAAQPHAGFVFDRMGPRRGQFAAQLAHPVRPDATVLLTVGSKPFLLTARDRFAWSRGSAQEAAIISAARFGSGMRIEARSPGHGRFVDSYSLTGAAGAIDAAAACSVRAR
ncbi:MAG: hypothetical protein ABIQ98_04340 [Sphingomicrobium sp.]